jgi:tripartite-type tricarboxylate transporter receptor subunit TctC
MFMKRFVLQFFALLCACVAVSAQPYPNKPIKVVVGYSAGGAVDAVARAVGQALSTSLGQPLVVENLSLIHI